MIKNQISINTITKRIFLVTLPVLFLFSCEKEGGLPRVETITSGSKWTLQIGSSPADVYSQLQRLGEEKQFADVAVAYRLPYSHPEEIQNRLDLYRSITLQNNSGRIERVVIEFNQDKVSSMQIGGAMLDSVSKWPQDTPDEITIHNNDLVENIYAKLLAIYRIPAYSNYQMILPDKALEKSFDPDMANYKEWRFNFSTDVRTGRSGMSSVTLYFKNAKLYKIRYDYNEYDVYN